MRIDGVNGMGSSGGSNPSEETNNASFQNLQRQMKSLSQERSNFDKGADGIISKNRPQKGDVDGNQKVNRFDLRALMKAFRFGNMDNAKPKDRKLNEDHFNKLNAKIIENQFPPPSGNKTFSGKKGDINRDGKFTYDDLSLLYQAMTRGNMNKDDKITRKDIRMLDRRV